MAIYIFLAGFGLATLLAAVLGAVLFLRELARRVKVMEELRKYHTHSTDAALLDAMAVLMRLELEEQQASEARAAWIGRARTILTEARKGPNAYPVDRPSGTRPIKKGEVKLWQLK